MADNGASSQTTDPAGGTLPSPLASGVVPDMSGATPIPHATTRPDEILRHDISDEELGMLSGSRRDGLLEALWGVLGVAGGSLIPAIVAVHDSYWVEPEKQTPLIFINLLQIVIFVAAILVATALAVVRSTRGKKTKDIVKEIRDRKKVT